MPSDPLLAEAVARVEWKLDIIVRQLQMLALQLGHVPPLMPMMQLEGTSCPVCNTPITHNIDIVAGAVKRTCSCGTGKLPPFTFTVAMTELKRGTGNESSDPGNAEGGGDGSERSKDRNRR